MRNYRSWLFVPLLVTLTACPPADDGDDSGEDTNGSTGTDEDGDGVSVGDGDCDDSDASVYPGATDADTDGTDQDCDGIDGPDADGDGYADAATGGDDCDDTDAAINPDASETWDDGIDQDCDGVADVEGASCSADLTLTFPDESSTTLDGCVDWDFDASFEYDPDNPPEVTEFTFTLGATTETEFECWIELAQQGVCGAGFYDQRESTGTTTMVLMDCTGVADDYESIFDGSQGYLRIDTLDAGSTSGSFAGEPLSTTLEGHLHVWTEDGIDLEGDLALTLVQVTGDGEEQTACVVVDGDEDGDGELHPNFDGGDCEDGDAFTFTGAAYTESPTACMTDADEDGWGSETPETGVEAGTDCDDSDASIYPGLATAEPTLCTIDNDGDGYGDATATAPFWTGTDCNDDDSSSYPGAPEIDDGLDNDCDGGFDEDFYELYILLNWTEPHDDMDLHLLAPGGTLGSNSDCYRMNCQDYAWGTLDWGVSGDTSDDPELINDDITGTGPEGIRIKAPEPGIFTVVVHDYPGSVFEDANETTIQVLYFGTEVWSETRQIEGEDSYTEFVSIDTATWVVTSL